MSRFTSRAATYIVAATVATLVLHTGSARAEEADDLKLTLTQFDLAIGEAMQYGNRAESSVRRDSVECLTAVARLTELGTAPTEMINGRERFLFKRAGDHCKEYAAWKATVEGAIVLADGQQAFAIVSSMDPGSVGDKFVETYVNKGLECAKGVDAALAAGALDGAKVNVEGVEITLPAGRAKWCDALVAWGGDFAKANKEAKAAAEKKVRDKYAKHGIKGDRLDLFVEYDDVYWRGKGCEIVDDIDVLKKAPLLFHWLENSDGTHTIRRYKLKGDKLVKKSDKTYDTQAAAQKGCK